MFELVVLVACRRASPEGTHGPGALARLPYTLEGVSYTFAIDDPAAEPPVSIGELWLYLRFVRLSPRGFSRRFGLLVFAVNDDDSRVPVPYPVGQPVTQPLVFGTFVFPDRDTVTNVTCRVPDLVVPRRGRFEFRLRVERRKPTWRGSRWRAVESHYLMVE